MAGRKVRWGHVSQINYSTRVGTTAWYNAHTPKIRKLSAWRYLHKLNKHTTIRRKARKMGANPSSDLRLKQMLAIARRAEAK